MVSLKRDYYVSLACQVGLARNSPSEEDAAGAAGCYRIAVVLAGEAGNLWPHADDDYTILRILRHHFRSTLAAG